MLLAVAVILAYGAQRRTAALREGLQRAEARIAALEARLARGALGAAGPAAAPAANDHQEEASIGEAPPAPEPAPVGAGVAEEIVVTASPRLSLSARLERAIAGNWLVWIGGALIALAIVFLLRFAIDQGWFGPPMQLAAAYMLGVLLYSAAECVRRMEPDEFWNLTQFHQLPAILAAASLFAFFGATYVGYANFAILTAPIAFTLMALSALGAILLSLRYGRWLAALGLSAGYAAPLLMRFEHAQPAALFGYVLALTAAALAVIRIRGWRGFVWLASGGALAWGVLWLSIPFAMLARDAAAFFFVALAALGAAFAWGDAGRAMAFGPGWRARAGWTESVLAAHALATAAALVLLAMLQQRYTPGVVGAMVSLCALATIAACLRDSFAAAPLAAALAGAGMIYFWPEGAPDLRAAGALGFVFSAGGWLMMARSATPAFGATLAALGPIAIVIATHHSGADLRAPILWSAAALMLAAINIFALERMARAPGGLDRSPGPAAAFALGAAAAVVFALFFLLRERFLWLAAALAILAPTMAYLDLRFRLPALRLAIAIVSGAVTARLLFGFDAFSEPISRTPLLNELLPAYGVPAAAFWLAAAMQRRAGAALRLSQALEAAAIIVGAAAVSMQIRHLATGGNMIAPYFTLFEVGAHAMAWIAIAIAIAARYGERPRFVLFMAELCAVCAAAGMAATFGGVFANPWWGAHPAAAYGWPVLNGLLAGIGLPAALLALYAVIKGRQGFRLRATAAGGVATLLFFLNATLEVRRAFHGPEM
ncbi:MAG: DUF2339 domain-containing protein, partial [Hyphomonadaceae bacterium]